MSLSSFETAEDHSNVENLRLAPTRTQFTVNRTPSEAGGISYVFTHQNISGTAVAKSNEYSGATLPNITERADRPQNIGRVRRSSETSDSRTFVPTFYALQEWEGYVVTINRRHFTARLVDLTATASIEQEEAVIPLCELTDADAERIREGSIFRWAIGYERSPSGVKKRISVIVFRDLPVLTHSDQSAGNNWATKMLASFPE